MTDYRMEDAVTGLPKINRAETQVESGNRGLHGDSDNQSRIVLVELCRYGLKKKVCFD